MKSNILILMQDFMKKIVTLPTGETFGQRLAKFRKAKGFTQAELAKYTGISPRMIAYYEAQTKHLPANYLPVISKTLKVSTDELLGLKYLKDDLKPKNVKLWKRLRLIDNLPPKDQKVLIHYLDTLLEKNLLR